MNKETYKTILHKETLHPKWEIFGKGNDIHDAPCKQRLNS